MSDQSALMVGASLLALGWLVLIGAAAVPMSRLGRLAWLWLGWPL